MNERGAYRTPVGLTMGGLSRTEATVRCNALLRVLNYALCKDYHIFLVFVGKDSA